MKLKKISLNNFQSFKDAEIDFESASNFVSDDRDSFFQTLIWSIRGIYKNQDTRSNGAGKSSILDAIIYALFGKSRTKKEDDLIRENTTDMEVELEFELNKNESVKIVRGKNEKKGYLNVSINNDDKTLGKTESQNLIEEKIGMDFELFVATVFFQQENQDKFVGSGPAERKNYLKKLLKLEVFDRAYKKISDKMKKIKEKMSEIKGTVDYLKEQVGNVNISFIKVELKNWKQRFEILKQDLEKLIKQKEKLIKENQKETQLESQIEDREAEIEDNESEIEGLKVIIKSLKTQKDCLETSLVIIEEKIKKLPPVLEKDLEKIKKTGEEKNSEIGKTNAITEHIENEIEQLKEKKEALKDEIICSKCNKELSFEYKKQFEDEINVQISTLLTNKDVQNKVLKKLKEDLKKDREDYKQIKIHLDNKKQYQSEKEKKEIKIKNIQENIKKENNNLEKNQSNLKIGQDNLKKYQEELKIIQDKDIKIKKEKLLKDIVDKESDKDTIFETIKKFENKKNNYESQKKEYEEKKEKHDKLRWKYNCLSILKKMFGKNGIISEVIKELTEEIELESNEILQKVNNGEHQILFRDIKESKDGNLSDSLDIYVENDRAIRVYESYSGGQRAIINFSIRTALSKILSKLNDVAFGLVALDEIFGALDEYNKDKMIDVINYLKPFFFQMLVISHTNLKDHFANEILIEYDNNTGISKIKGIY